MGFTDILPFILGIAGGVGAGISGDLAIIAILISIASNNLVKGGYAFALGDRRTGTWAMGGLAVLAALTLLARALT